MTVILGRRDTLQTSFVRDLNHNTFTPPHWTFQKNIAFIHEIVHERKKIKCVIHNDYNPTAFEMFLFKKRLHSLPRVKYVIETANHEDFSDALINELYRGVCKGASMLAIELNILFGFGYMISNIKKQNKYFTFDLQKNKYKNIFNFCYIN